jgi:hypothetical protein
MEANSRLRGIVRLVRLDLYNHGLACGAGAIRHQLDNVEQLNPLPSLRTIGRILADEGLTYGRTGRYEGERPSRAPASAR